jgi:hypothetical protein
MFSVISLLFIWVTAGAEQIDLGTGIENVSVTVEESNDIRTVIKFEVGTFSQVPVRIDNEQYYLPSISGESILLNKGEPALPRICRSIIIPDDARMKVNIISSEYTDFHQTPIAPSKGNLPRTVNPEDIPYTFGPIYSTGQWYPGSVAEAREPYILRDYRGTVVDFNAFQYNPVTQTLRVYTSVTVEVVTEGPGEINILRNSKRAESTIPDFELIYKRRFINYDFFQGKYTPVVERGDMLIITYDDYRQYIEPLAEWKRQKGIKTWVVDVSEIGNNGSAIDAWIQDFYDADSTNLAFVLLVGDHAQVNKPLGGGNSDPVYSKVAGGDNYPDIFIGRFSAQSPGDVQTQVDRTITYETTPPAGDWFHKGFGIGSNDPNTGQGGEHDWEHEDLMRDDLLNFTYTQVDQLYATVGASASDVSNSLNDGRSIGNYTGHGAPTSWSTTSYSNSHINNLTNDNMLPFIVSVACNNGEFDTYTCFGEAWLRATNNGTGAPTGAIGFYGSLISQSWTPPMDAQDEVVDLLCAMEKVTYGGLCFNGSCKMMDLNGSGGVSEFNAWTIFGDPSLLVRTDTPAPMTVTHDAAILFTLTEFPVQVVGVEGALCALYANGTLFGSAYTDATGNAIIPIEGSLPIGEDISLTVTAFNKETYIAAIPAISPDGPYVVHENNVIDDGPGGNGNGMIDYGESIILGVELKNVGPDPATNLTAVLSTTDSYVTITDDTELYGDIPPDFATVYIADAFAFDVLPDAPDQHSIEFLITISETSRDSVWTSTIFLTSHAPSLEYLALEINDPSGNNNGVLDPGETAELVVTLNNIGSGQADDVAAILSETDLYVSVSDDAGGFGTIVASGGTGDNELDVFVVSADPSAPRGHEATLQLDLTAVNGFSATVYFTVIVGDRVIFFADDFAFDQGWSGLGGSGEWTIGAATGGSGSDSYGGPDPGTDNSLTSDNGVLGNDLTSGNGGDYNGSLSTTYWVTSPLIDCADFNGVILSYYQWLGVERNSYDHVYFQVNDGGNWVTLFENGGSNIDESAWSEQVFDVSAYADSNPSFQIRFGMGPTDGSMNYCGWNLDDLSIKGYGERVSAQISLDTETLIDSLIPGDVVEETITIFNLSTEATLRVSFIPDVSWITCDGEQQYIDPEASQEFIFTINTAGMDPGDYVGNVTYISNDYSNQYDTVQVLLHLHAPEMLIITNVIEETLEGNGQSNHQIAIDNLGPGRLEFETGCVMFRGSQPALAKTVVNDEPLGTRPADEDKSDATEPYYAAQDRGFGGPDGFGYVWSDSDEPGGPTYGWVNISGTGTMIALGDDEASDPLTLGFDFPYYENIYSEVYIGSNGILTFGDPSTSRINTALPTATVPNDVIAMWWDDLDPAEAGNIYYYSDIANERFIVSFVGVPNYISGGGTGSLSFQAILHANGQVILQYATMDPGSDADGLTGATIGLENIDGTDGLEVVYNAAYMHDFLAISLNAARWMTVSPASGTVEPYSSGTLTVGFDATDLEEGEYTGQVTITCNDPVISTHNIFVMLSVESYTCGDANGDGDLNVADAVMLINFVFKGGPAPEPLEAGDANGDGDVNVADAVHMINFVFKGGPDPIC